MQFFTVKKAGTSRSPLLPSSRGLHKSIIPEELLTHLPLPGVVELDIFQGVDIAGDIALAAGLENDEIVVPHVVEDALPVGGALGADKEGGGDEVPPVAQQHGL